MPTTPATEIIDELARDPLPNIVLLKQLMAFREQVRVHRISGTQGLGVLVELETAFSPWDLQTYPTSAVTAFISSDHPDLTAALITHVPRDVGIVFKLSRQADLGPVEAQFSLSRRTAFVSFTSTATIKPAADASITLAPTDAAYRLFETQGHTREWLEQLLHTGKAFASVLERDGDLLSACLAFEIYGRIWEIGGVVTPPVHRRKQYGTAVVRSALAELSKRGLMPRYQVEEHNKASIGLAQSVGLTPFLTIEHYAHEAN
jgi:RimJ/RimL family protein N-acetyltransferase